MMERGKPLQRLSSFAVFRVQPSSPCFCLIALISFPDESPRSTWAEGENAAPYSQAEQLHSKATSVRKQLLKAWCPISVHHTLWHGFTPRVLVQHQKRLQITESCVLSDAGNPNTDAASDCDCGQGTALWTDFSPGVRFADIAVFKVFIELT